MEFTPVPSPCKHEQNTCSNPNIIALARGLAGIEAMSMKTMLGMDWTTVAEALNQDWAKCPYLIVDKRSPQLLVSIQVC